MPVQIVQHPVAQDSLLVLRDVRTPPDEFRRAAARITMVLMTEATRDMPRARRTVETPLGPAQGDGIDTDVVIVPVLRAGLGMLESALAMIPRARVGYLGLQRDEATAVASRYYTRLPAGLTDSYVLVVDPMLATGGSAVAALDVLQRAGAGDLRLVCIVAAPEGVAHVQQHRPTLPIYTAAIDDSLNARKFIVPGLGDFGDRLYGTD